MRGNRIRECGQLAREHAAIWTTLFRSGGDRLHRNLLITDNEITGFPSPVILLRDAQNVLVRDNRIQLVPPLAPGPSPMDPIILRNTVGVRLESNRLNSSR